MDVSTLPLVRDIHTPLAQALIRGLKEADARSGPEILKVSDECWKAAREEGHETLEEVRDAVESHVRESYAFPLPVADWSGAVRVGNLVEIPVFLDPGDGQDSLLHTLRLEFLGGTFLPIITLEGGHG